MDSSFVRRELAKPHEILNDAVRHYARTAGIGVAGQAAMIGKQTYGREISSSLLYKFCEGERPIPLDVWLTVYRYTRYEPMARFMAACHDGLFVSLPDADAPDTSNLLGLIREYTEAAEEVARALQDGRVTAAEYARCERELDEAIEAALRLREYLAMRRDEDGRARTLRDSEPQYARARR